MVVDKERFEEKLFEKKNPAADASDKMGDEKKLPMVIKVFDFPMVHHNWNESVSYKLLDALAKTEHMAIFETKFV